MASLQEQMTRVLRDIRSMCEAHEPIERIMEEVGNRYGLHEPNDDSQYPTWLIRIIEGEHTDYHNDEGHWYKETRSSASGPPNGYDGIPTLDEEEQGEF